MQITPAATENVVVQSSAVASRQDQRPVQAQAEQQVQAPQKDNVTLSQAAKDLAAQLSDRPAPEERKEPPVVETREEPANAPG